MSAPQLAGFGEERIAATSLVLLGTIRSDGWPRISPCEAYFVDGELMLGMMWRSKKALDLLRDPRITVTTAQADRNAQFGDLKLYGMAVDIRDEARRKAHADVQEKAINWRPTEPYHLFAVDILRAGFISFGADRRLLRWSPESGVEVMQHPDSAPEHPG